jgi:hypothetical protein
METVKQTPASELGFIGKIVKKTMEGLKTTWDMTVAGAAMLGVASAGNPGKAFYILDQIDPQPGSTVTDSDIAGKFPLGIEGDWETIWDEFNQGDQRRVFKH